MNIVISQPNLFPWVGMLEQIRLADIFVHYDDVQFSKGSFVNRVQLKYENSTSWLTVPLKKFKLGDAINQVEISEDNKWKEKHLRLLKKSLGDTLYFKDALNIIQKVYSHEYSNIGDLAKASLLELSDYYNLSDTTKFVNISELNIPGKGSERVLKIVKELGGNKYITGHGAKNYLDHTLFEKNKIEVLYMNYEKKNYPQKNGCFTPYVSSLDLISNQGKKGINFIISRAENWKQQLAKK
jgi:hypothetical protein